MKKLLLPLLTLAFAMPQLRSAAQSQPHETKSIEVSHEITKISTSGGVVLILTDQHPDRIVVDYSASRGRDVDVNFRGSEVILTGRDLQSEQQPRGRRGRRNNIQRSRGYQASPTVYVPVHAVNELNLSGGCILESGSPMMAGDIVITARGGTILKPQLETGSLKLELTGGCIAEPAGRYDRLEAKLSGGSILKARLDNVMTRVELSGGSIAEMDGRTETLELTAHGGTSAKMQVDAGTMSVELSGGSRAELAGQYGDVSITMQGSAIFKGLNITAESLQASTSGGSILEIEGRSPKADYIAGGGSRIDALRFETDVTDIISNGGAIVRVNARENINILSSGGSTVEYTGDAAVRMAPNSSSSVRKR